MKWNEINYILVIEGLIYFSMNPFHFNVLKNNNKKEKKKPLKLLLLSHTLLERKISNSLVY